MTFQLFVHFFDIWLTLKPNIVAKPASLFKDWFSLFHSILIFLVMFTFIFVHIYLFLIEVQVGIKTNWVTPSIISLYTRWVTNFLVVTDSTVYVSNRKIHASMLSNDSKFHWKVQTSMRITNFDLLHLSSKEFTAIRWLLLVGISCK